MKSIYILSNPFICISFFDLLINFHRQKASSVKLFLLLLVLSLGGNLNAQSNFIVVNGAQVLVTENAALVIEGPITNNGQVTIESGSSLIQTHTGANSNNNSSTYAIKRIGANATTKYNIWSSPIKEANLWNTFGGNPCDMYTFKASTQEWKYDFNTGAGPAPCNGNNVTFSSAHMVTPDATADGIMDPTRGYFIPGKTNNERVFTGNVNNGDLTATIWSTGTSSSLWSGDNWNLIGNPYPSALDLVTFWNVNTGSGAISDGIYFWNDQGNLNYNQCSNYVVWNLLGVASSCGVTATAAVSAQVASGQGFWLYSASGVTGTALIQFNNSMRKSASNGTFYKRSSNIERAWISVKRDNEISNQILLGLTDDATVGYDPKYDAHKLPAGASLELSFKQDTGRYVILGQPSLSYQEQEKLPLHLETNQSGIHEFIMDSTQNVTGGNQYFIIDNELLIVQNLSQPYRVRLDSGAYENRFFLLYKDLVNSTNETSVSFVKIFQSSENIRLQSNKTNIENVSIYSTTGALITERKKNNSPEFSFSTRSLATGVYFIKYELTNGLSETKKLVIQ